MHKRIPKAEPKQAKIKPEVNQKTGDVETDVKPMVFMTSFCARCKNDDPKLKHTFLCETRIKELELSNKLAFHKFILDNILIKTVSEKGKRFAKIIILQGLQNVEKYYDVIMTCDTEAIDKSIEKIRKEKNEYENKAQIEIFKKEVFGKNLESYEDRIKEFENQRQDLIVQCPDIKFPVKREKVDDSKYPNIKIEFSITKKSANRLNDAWDNIPNYKLQLQPFYE